MRIAISGTANTGKSTLIGDFLKRWPNFKTPATSYRHIIEKYKDNHSAHTTENVQQEIMDFMIELHKQYEPEDNVIFDRCCLDNLVYTLWGVHNGTIDSEYADKVIPLVRESLRNLDIIFLIPFDPRIPIEEDGVRNADPKYIKEIDAIFQLMFQDYIANDDSTFLIFPREDMPALIQIGGTRHQRIAQIAEYVDPLGGVVDTLPEESVFSEEQLKQMEEFVKMQQQLQLEEKWGIS